mgnify:FL=1
MSTDTSTPPGAPASTWRRVLIAVAALVAIAITLSLGRWQLSRAAQKEALQAAISEQKTLPALGGPALAATKDIANVLHRRVVLRGTWLPQYTVYLDNRQMRGQPGFYVVTPLQLENSQDVVLVQRGWLPRNFLDRTQLPPLDTPTGVVALEGRVARPPSKLFEFAAVQSPTGAGKPAQRSSHIRQNLDLADFRAETQLPLRDVSVLQTGDASEGLLRDWPEVASGVEKHYGYAFQWFGLAGLITLLYVWFQIVRRFHPARRSPASAPE